MAWLILILAGLFEVAWAFGLKQSDGFSRPVPTILTVVCLAISMALLAAAMRTLPLGTAYAVWTGIGTIGSVILGIAVLREPATAPRLICVALIVAGIAGLKLTARA